MATLIFAEAIDAKIYLIKRVQGCAHHDSSWSVKKPFLSSQHPPTLLVGQGRDLAQPDTISSWNHTDG